MCPNVTPSKGIWTSAYTDSDPGSISAGGRIPYAAAGHGGRDAGQPGARHAAQQGAAGGGLGPPPLGRVPTRQLQVPDMGKLLRSLLADSCGFPATMFASCKWPVCGDCLTSQYLACARTRPCHGQGLVAALIDGSSNQLGSCKAPVKLIERAGKYQTVSEENTGSVRTCNT
jgi:hypothetical protein